MSESIITKNAMAASLKELMKKRDLRKISVADIVEHCGLNRQTFYYHFHDKYDLLNWIFYYQVIAPLTDNRTFEDWNIVVLEVLRNMKKDQAFYTNALSDPGQNTFQDYLVEVTKDLFMRIIQVLDQDGSIDPKDVEFIAECYTYGIVGIIIQWARKGMRETPELMTERLCHFVDDSKKFAAQRYLREQEP